MSSPRTPNPYQHLHLSAEEIQQRFHRRVIGGMWERKGRLQLEFAVSHGLQPGHRVLDIGCGPLRAGIHFIRYLEPGHYFGLDINESLLAAGREVELEAVGLSSKLPPQNLLCDDGFRFERFAQEFDVAVAHSLFTHLPRHQIRHCLTQLVTCMVPGGRLFATFYECPDDHPLEVPIVHPNGLRSYADRDFYHYRRADLAECAGEQSWSFAYVGEWGHPSGQKMCILTRL